MKKIWPYLFLVLTVLIFFRPFVLKGFLPIPSDTIVGLYNPFRDMYAQQYPRGVPFKNFLITDPVRQQVPWKNLAIGLEKQFELPLWNPYSFAGYPLLGNFQTAAFYPLNILFFVLPFATAWSLFILLQPVLGGIFLYLYLRHLKLHRVACLLGSISFAFSGFSVAWMEWGNVVHTLVWLPLLLLAIDKVFSTKKKDSGFKIQDLRKISLWGLILVLSLTSSFFAGHLQLFFYEFLVAFVYFLVRFSQNKSWKVLFVFIILVVCFLILTSIQWIPTMQFIFYSARSVDQNYLTTAGWFVPYQNLLQFIAPDFFGNPATLNYWGVWNYAEFVGYIGMLPLIVVLFAIIFRHDKKTWFFALVAFIAFLFALPTPLGKLPFVLTIPFLSTSQPTRLLGIVDFCLPVLAALGMDCLLKKTSKNIFIILLGLFALFGLLWFYTLRLHIGITLENSLIAKQNLILPTALFFSSCILLVALVFIKQTKVRFIIFCLLFILVVGDLLRFASKFSPFTDPSYLFPHEKTLSFLQNNSGNSRYMTTDSRIMAPNFSVLYHLQSVDGYDPLYLQNYAELIAASERGKPDIHTPFGFNRIITPHNYDSFIMDLLGVKYVLSLDELRIQKLKKVYQEGETRVYENTSALPRAFFVKKLIPVNSKQEDIQSLFINQTNVKNTATIEYVGDMPSTLAQGTVEITLYTPNKVILTTNNVGDGFVVLSDMYYPSWSVSIDGKETRMYQADYALRGVFVPKGKHTIAFYDHLF